MECLGILLLGLIDDLNAVVIAAVLANAMGQLLFVALGALDDARQAELPVGTTGTTAGLGYFTLGYSHGYTSSFCYPETGLQKSSACANLSPGRTVANVLQVQPLSASVPAS